MKAEIKNISIEIGRNDLKYAYNGRSFSAKESINIEIKTVLELPKSIIAEIIFSAKEVA